MTCFPLTAGEQTGRQAAEREPVSWDCPGRLSGQFSWPSLWFSAAPKDGPTLPLSPSVFSRLLLWIFKSFRSA